MADIGAERRIAGKGTEEDLQVSKTQSGKVVHPYSTPDLSTEYSYEGRPSSAMTKSEQEVVRSIERQVEPKEETRSPPRASSEGISASVPFSQLSPDSRERLGQENLAILGAITSDSEDGA